MVIVNVEAGAHQDPFPTNWGELSPLSPASVELGRGWPAHVVGLAEGEPKESLFLGLAGGLDAGGQKMTGRPTSGGGSWLSLTQALG